MSLVETINHGIKEAIRSRNTVRLDTLRMLKSKILAADARANLSDEEVQKLFKTYHGNLLEALEHAMQAKRADLTEKLKAEIAIVEEFLPQTLSLEETRKVVVEAIAESGAKTQKELGLVMKCIMKRNLGVDAKLAKELASEQLSHLENH